MVRANTSSKGDDNSSRNSGSAAIIIRKADLDRAVSDLNDAITVLTAGLVSGSMVGELRRVHRQLVNLQKKQTGTTRR